MSAQTAADASSAPPRRSELFDRDWKFHLGDAPGAEKAVFNDAGWRGLDLPHDWSIEGPPGADPSAMEGPFDHKSPAGASGAYLNGGIGWYRKTFTIPAASSGRRVSILFDGAYQNADVYLNGTKLGSHPYGFTSFFYDLTPLLKFGAGSNVLAVRLEVRQPGCRWYSGAGIYRHVHLITTRPVHVAPWGVAITTPQVSTASAQVKVRTEVSNDLPPGDAPAHATLTTIILDPTGKEVARRTDDQPVPAGKSGSFDQVIPVSGPQLWSCATPTLYRAVSEVRVGDRLVDSLTTNFGIRTIAFTRDQGFFLNGRRLQIQGVCDHHDLGCLGAAVHWRALQRQIEILKSFGCNAIRTSHNPPAPELLDLCDAMGILVMDEAFDEWKMDHNKYGYAENFDQWSEPDLVSMIHRDRNHPCIILYSIGNEIMEGSRGLPEAGATAQRLVAICHREDPTRPVTSACPAPANAWKCGLAQALDVFGINYSPGWYRRNGPDAATIFQNPTDGYHGQLPMIASETASAVDTRGEYGLRLDDQPIVGTVQVDLRPHFQVTSYDYWQPGDSAESSLISLKESPWVAGEFVWTGFDYLGEPTPFQWPARSSYFGLVDLAGFPKDRYYLYQSAWTDRLMVHVLPMSWNWTGLEGRRIPVQVFTNASSVELFLNGRTLGRKNFPEDTAEGFNVRQHLNGNTTDVKILRGPSLHLEWFVPYEPGELKAVATKDGQVVATDIVRTAGAPSAIVLSADRDKIDGDGRDLSYIKATIVDPNGTVCPNAGNEITYALNGDAAKIAGLDNGDPTNHEAFQGTRHAAFHGLSLAVLQSRDDATGDITLTASADGLQSGRVTIHVVAPAPPDAQTQ